MCRISLESRSVVYGRIYAVSCTGSVNEDRKRPVFFFVYRRISQYTVVYDRACLTWVVLISDTMRQRLGLDVDRTVRPHSFGSQIDTILSSRGPYQQCKHVQLSLDPITYRLKSIAYPVLVPDLPVDFVLGTLYLDDLNLSWSSSLNRMSTRREVEEEREKEARRETYRNILQKEYNRRNKPPPPK